MENYMKFHNYMNFSWNVPFFLDNKEEYIKSKYQKIK